MRQMIFLRADKALIDRVFQPSVDYVSLYCAVDCFWVARLCIDIASLALIASQFDGTSAALRSGQTAWAAIQLSLVLLGLGSFIVLREVFRRVGGGARRSPGHANPLRHGMQVHRVFCWFWLANLAVQAIGASVSLAMVATGAVGLFTTMALYVGSCSNRPRQWRATRDTRTAMIAEAPV